MKIATIGRGNVGGGLADLCETAGHEVLGLAGSAGTSPGRTLTCGRWGPFCLVRAHATIEARVELRPRRILGSTASAL